MSAAPHSRSHVLHASALGGDQGLMPDLYRITVGPVNAAYYQQHFRRFEAQGKATPTWNHGAAFFTLAWLLLRKLWRPAAVYAGLVSALALIWWVGLHGRIPAGLEAGLLLAAGAALCALPGAMGNALYYHHVRQQTLRTLSQASSMTQARALLAHSAVTPERLHTVAALQALVTAAVLGLALHRTDFSALRALTQTNTPSAPPIAVGPPTLAIPAPSSVQMLPAITHAEAPPELAAATATAADSATATTPTADTPTEEAAAAISQDAALADTTSTPTPSATAASAPPAAPPVDAETLSVLTLAQSISSAAAVVPTDTTAAVQTPAPSTASEATPNPPPNSAAKTASKVAAPKTAASDAPTRLQPGKFYLNVGVYAQPANARAAVQKLKNARLKVIEQTISSSKGDLTRLRVGPFDTRQQADKAVIQVQSLRIEAKVFQQPRP